MRSCHARSHRLQRRHGAHDARQRAEDARSDLAKILSGNTALVLFAFSLLSVFLCLAALYESWSVPISVMLVVPLGVLGAVGAMLGTLGLVLGPQSPSMQAAFTRIDRLAEISTI